MNEFSNATFELYDKFIKATINLSSSRKQTKFITYEQFSYMFGDYKINTPLFIKPILYYALNDNIETIITHRQYQWYDFDLVRGDEVRLFIPNMFFKYSIKTVDGFKRIKKVKIYVSFFLENGNSKVAAPKFPNVYKNGSICFGNAVLPSNFTDINKISEVENIFLSGVHNNDLNPISTITDSDNIKHKNEEEFFSMLCQQPIELKDILGEIKE